jgi:uncharacterized membrane protein YkvA (DUF1232 family)
MRVSFELGERDLRYFRDRLQKVRKSKSARAEDRVILGAVKLVEEVADADPPEFVTERISKLSQLIDMLRDAEWRLEGEDRTRILDALAYFVDPDDIIPDRVPGLGYLDDAIMVELVVKELTHELAAYADFCAYRELHKKDEDIAHASPASPGALRGPLARKAVALASRALVEVALVEVGEGARPGLSEAFSRTGIRSRARCA